MNQIPQPLLGTPHQRAAERLLMQLIGDPDLIDVQGALKRELSGGEIGKTPAASATLDRAIAQWTNSLIFKEICTHHPAAGFLWGTDDTPRTWFGYTLGGVGASGDNPDNIYRSAVIDGAKSYEIVGQLDPRNRAEQLVIQVDQANLVDPASMFDMKSKMPSIVGATLALLSDSDIRPDGEGRFRITLGSGEHCENHVELKRGIISVGVRDLLSDWRQRPARLILRELGGVSADDLRMAESLDQDEIKAHLLKDLPAYIRFWGKFPSIWFGGLQPNTISSPRGRVGGWGFVAGMSFAIAPDEAVIVTTSRGDAAYTGFQLNSPWMIQADATANQVCLNSSQAKPNPDGTFTYVISQSDPGVANWLDTVGVNSGIGILRWQKVPKEMTADALIREFRVVGLSEVHDMTYLPRVTVQQRHDEITARAAAYGSRTS
jgi:hypothetical protein